MFTIYVIIQEMYKILFYSNLWDFFLIFFFFNLTVRIFGFKKENKGVIMFSFYNYFVTCSDTASLKDVKDHINYVRNLIGSDYIGIGSDYDGVAEYFIIRKN